MKKLNKIILTIIGGLLIATIANAYLGNYWKTVSDIIPRTADTVDIGAVGKNVRAGYFSALTTDSLSDGTLTITGGDLTTTGGGTFGDLAVDTDTLYVDSANNRVGIGTAAPSKTLEVNGEIYSKGDMNASTDGSSTTIPRVFGYKDLTSGEAARFQFGDAHNGLQNAYANDTTLYSYWGLVLSGGMQNYNSGFEPPPFTKTTDVGVLVKSTNDIGDDPGAGATNITTFAVQAVAGQTNNLTEWRNSSGNALSVVDSNGNIGIGTASPTEALDLSSGNLTTTGTGYFGTDKKIASDTHNGDFSNAIYLTADLIPSLIPEKTFQSLPSYEYYITFTSGAQTGNSFDIITATDDTPDYIALDGYTAGDASEGDTFDIYRRVSVLADTMNLRSGSISDTTGTIYFPDTNINTNGTTTAEHLYSTDDLVVDNDVSVGNYFTITGSNGRWKTRGGGTDITWEMGAGNTFQGTRYANSSGAGVNFVNRTANGTEASHAGLTGSLNNGDTLGGTNYRAWDGHYAGSWTGNIGRFAFIADGDHGDNSTPVKMSIYTCPSGSTTGVERFTVNANGNVRVFNSLKVGADADPTVALDVSGGITATDTISTERLFQLKEIAEPASTPSSGEAFIYLNSSTNDLEIKWDNGATSTVSTHP